MIRRKPSNSIWLLAFLFPLTLCNLGSVVDLVFATPTPTSTPTPLPTPTPTPIVRMSVREWENLFRQVWNDEHVRYDEISRGMDGALHYHLCYGVDGNISMYQATGNQEYLDRALYYVNNVVAAAKVSSSLEGSQFKDKYMSWGVYTKTESIGRESPLHDGHFFRYASHLLRIIRENPELYNDPKYKTQVDSLLDFIEVNVVEKWYKRGPHYLYADITYMAAHWAYITMELSLITPDPERRKLYKVIYTKINANMAPYQESSLRGQIIPNPENSLAYFWNQRFGSFKTPGQDTSHGNNVIAYMVEAHDLGIFWTNEDIQGLENLLTLVLWNGSYQEPSFGGYFDGSDPGGGYFQSDGFVKLGRYDPYVQRIYEVYRPDKNLTQYYGNAAYNAKRLEELGMLK